MLAQPLKLERHFPRVNSHSCCHVLMPPHVAKRAETVAFPSTVNEKLDFFPPAPRNAYVQIVSTMKIQPAGLNEFQLRYVDKATPNV
mgnify:FL=1